ncbi:2-phosphosulfolactate phosphatase [Chloroherpeton thalassium ATCC 35110]|uniref:Probable 2-phosphosulfolactate phosphatase n=1 Tax=Chloroherpeton thalassium (strain ATCC 35110 / GB-78) TaxID=517418 RepID=B3QV25_CHLT3|nr:2-phosphosulfolactate phosphatase [Chloroherpeton thalassium]ACF12979.1 2-phosphosulfolactate phosphatase [Chloroherpeton thalassium ATCC 35110]
MKVDVFLTPAGIDEHHLRDRIVVIIDVLRASTSIVMALQNGAKEVIPVEEVEKALKIASSLAKGQALLCGERNGQKIEGFNLDNSPEAYDEDTVKGKSLVYCSTNGSKTLSLTQSAVIKDLLVAAFTNITVVKEYIVKPENAENHLAIICAGKSSRFSLEDTICAGLLIDKLMADKKNQTGYILSDTARAAKILYEQFRGNELGALKESEHGRFLISLGYERDIEVCAKIDSSQALPQLENGVLKLSKFETKKYKRVS